MIYPRDFESKIGFSQLRDLIIEKCECRVAREEAAAMSFSNDYDIVSERLEAVSEMVSILESGQILPLSSIHDVNPWLTPLRSVGAYMSADRFYKLMVMLTTLGNVVSFFSAKSDDGLDRWPRLAGRFSVLTTFPHIIVDIERKITRFGTIRDDASERLYDIRSRIRAASGSMASVMRRVMDRVVAEGLVDPDIAPSLRDGRMVIPVPAGSKRKINGIVHDESATGKTVFIEPAEVVEAGNRLRELEMEQRREEIAVLTALAESIRPYIDDIADGMNSLGLLDFIRAKALFAIETSAQLPEIENKPEIDWYHAVHPGLLLNLQRLGKEPVAMNLKLGQEKRILVVSGPNAGGKSVTLKTVATIQYMLQCGFLPTLYSNSHVGIFDKIFIDIGDEQSIENELSTYSSHLRNMKYFLANADCRSIVLADEMGSGTEPQIGGALAQAILDRLGKSGCIGVITTHYQNIKQFAETAEGFINGAMVYDRQNLRPTFQLAVGNAGSSFALEIARNTGLPADVLESAKNIVGSDYVNNDKYLLDIARDRRYWANKRLNIKEKEKRLDDLLSTYEDSASSLKSQRNSIIRQARKEAEEIVAGANARIERAIHEIRIAEAEREKTIRVRKDLAEYRESLDRDTSDDVLPEVLRPLRHKSKKRKNVSVDDIKTVDNSSVVFSVGQYVKMSGGGVTGKILSIKDKKAEVAFGGLRTYVQLDRLAVASQPAKTVSTQSYSVSVQTQENSRKRQLAFRNEIDVRGMRADEAIQAVTYFLDDAVQFNASRVRILHGTGHGILKTLIRQQLKINPAVRNFYDEDIRFGGAGITIADLA